MQKFCGQVEYFLYRWVIPHFLANRVPRSVILYFFVGILATSTDFAIFWFVSVFLGMHYTIGATIAFFFATAVNFSFNKYLTFQNGSERIGKQLAKHVSVGLSSLTLSYGVLYVLIDLVGFHKMIGKIISAPLLAIYAYIAHKHFTFTKE